MNAPERLPLPDIQSTPDTRKLAIARVGVKGLRQPLRVQSVDGTATMTVASVDMYAGLPAGQKGTHMSRCWSATAATCRPPGLPRCSITC